jgi:flagellar L-ring protein precursor FlgH
MNRMTRIPLALLACSALASRAGSLWPAEATGMTADHKAGHTGDILTVVVQESANASSTQNKEATRKSSVNDAVQQFIFPAATSGLGTHAGQLPSFQVSGSSDYTGGGQVSNSQTVSSQAAVLVTDVLPNGNLVIEGVRLVSFSGETQYVVLHGLVRPDDIASNNTVLSSNIAEARVEFVNKGALTQAENPGWLSRIYEFLRPF